MGNTRQSLENTRRSFENTRQSSEDPEFDATRSLLQNVDLSEATTQMRFFENLKPGVVREFKEIEEKYQKGKSGLDKRVLSIIDRRAEIQEAHEFEGTTSPSSREAKDLRALYRDLTKESTDVVPTLKEHLSKIEQSQKDFKGAFDSAVQQGFIDSRQINSVTEPMSTFVRTGRNEMIRIQDSITREKRAIKELYSRRTGSNIEADIKFENLKPQLEGIKDSVKREYEKVVNTYGPKEMGINARLNAIHEKRESIEDAFNKIVGKNVDAPLPSSYAKSLRGLYRALTSTSKLTVPQLEKHVGEVEALHDAFETVYGPLAQGSHMGAPFIREVTEPMRSFAETGKRNIEKIQTSITDEKTNIKDLYRSGTQGGDIERDILIEDQQGRRR